MSMPGIKVRGAPPHDDAPDRLVPLINVVFLMLIFFMLVGTVRHTDSSTIQPPSSTVNAARAAGPVDVLLSPDGEVRINGQPVDAQRTALIQQTLVSALPGANGRLEIRADRQARVRLLNRIFSAAGRAGASEIKLVTQRR